jgi:hypothetical protein
MVTASPLAACSRRSSCGCLHSLPPKTAASKAASAAAAAVLLLLVVLLGALPASRATHMPECTNPFLYDYKLITYSNPNEGGRNYTLFDVWTAKGCLNNWGIAKRICDSRGLEMAPQGERKSLGTYVHAPPHEPSHRHAQVYLLATCHACAGPGGE